MLIFIHIFVLRDKPTCRSPRPNLSSTASIVCSTRLSGVCAPDSPKRSVCTDDSSVQPLMPTPIRRTGWPSNFFTAAITSGSARMHGAHHVAQKNSMCERPSRSRSSACATGCRSPGSAGAWRLQAQWTVYSDENNTPEDFAMGLLAQALHEHIRQTLEGAANQALTQYLDRLTGRLGAVLKKITPAGVELDMSALRLRTIDIQIVPQGIRLDGTASGSARLVRQGSGPES